MSIAYTVRAELASPAIAEAWLAWMRDHARHVVEAGAQSAQVVRLDEQLVCEARYVFASREALEAYLRDHAPRLRADGLRTFPDGVSLSRTIGEIVLE